MALERTDVQPGHTLNEDPENASEGNWNRCHHLARRLALGLERWHGGFLKSACWDDASWHYISKISLILEEWVLFALSSVNSFLSVCGPDALLWSNVWKILGILFIFHKFAALFRSKTQQTFTRLEQFRKVRHHSCHIIISAYWLYCSNIFWYVKMSVDCLKKSVQLLNLLRIAVMMMMMIGHSHCGSLW